MKMKVKMKRAQKKKIESKTTGKMDKEMKRDESKAISASMDRLREELSCAICLEICFEPSTTPCGHSFCKKCLRSAADQCGEKCPKCRQLIRKARYCRVNTVLWNTIQLLFPQEVEERKETMTTALMSQNDNIGDLHRSRERSRRHDLRDQSVGSYGSSSRGGGDARRGEEAESQNEEEQQRRRLARENLRRIHHHYV